MVALRVLRGLFMNQVRLTNIKLRHFKNVRNGSIDLSKGHNADSSCNVLGIYGQNGSGKTALIDSLQILKHLLSPFPCYSPGDIQEWVHYINVESQTSELTWSFRINDQKDNVHMIEYSVVLQKYEQCLIAENIAPTQRIQFINERIAVTSVTTQKKVRKTVLIDTNADGVFKPATRFRSITSSNKKIKEDLIIAKELAKERARSFVFSLEFANILTQATSKDNALLKDIVTRLHYYGQYELFIIKTLSTGLISLNALPISFTYERPQLKATGSILIPLNGDRPIPQSAFDTAQILIKHMNIVLRELVPGLTIALKKIGTNLQPDGETYVTVQLVSLKNTQEIPLKYESEGIKKIISVLHLLIEVFNRPSTTVAIDELDSGVFEYLLGELLQIISSRGCGQLIFTSHNLRPLEMLHHNMIAFTTTNPDNRYIRLRDVKSNNNLRSFYYRDIILGGQPEEVYCHTNNSDITYAFLSAGELMNNESQGDDNGL